MKRFTSASKLLIGCILTVLVAACNARRNGTGEGSVTPAIESGYVGNQSHDSSKEICVVFVHGVFGDDTTWGKGEMTLPHLLSTDSRIAERIDAFIFEFSSPWLGDANKLADLAEQLRGALADNDVWRHKKVIFVAHSMGGLVVREYLRNHKEHLGQIPMLYFYAVPTNGAVVAGVAQQLSKNRQLSGILPIQGNDFLTSITNGWLASAELKKIRTYCAFEGLPTYGIWVVPQQSATALCTENADPLTADHIQIVKPTSRKDPRFTRLLTAIVDSSDSRNGQMTDQDSEQSGSDVNTRNTIRQSSSAPGSPNINNVQGSVTITIDQSDAGRKSRKSVPKSSPK